MAKRKSSTTGKPERSDSRDRQPAKREHDPDSEPPRTADPPDRQDKDKKDWRRQEGC